MPRTPRGSGGDRAITSEGLERLLDRLHPDRDEAAREYEHLRRALFRFFENRGAADPDDCADIAIDRLARRLEERTAIDNVRQYAYGIARLVLLERLRLPQTAPIDLLSALPDALPDHSGDDPRQASFDRCLAAIAPESRHLLLAYYESQGAGRIANRRRLAAARGLSDNALRSRVQRLRERLDACIRARLSRVR